jgi:alpha-ribazole phosphatase/probable phosphoglycerate mutase
MAEKVYIIRHGLTESNKKKIYAGWKDDSICVEGINKLLKIGKKLKKFNINKIFSSPLNRAIQTAEVMNTFLNTTIEIEDDLREMKMGKWEGLSEYDVADKFPEEWGLWNTRPSQLKLKGRETLHELQMRAINAVKKISDNSNYSRILIVTHVAIIRILMIYYNHLPLDKYRKIYVPNAGLYRLDIKAQKKKISRIF